MDHITLLSDVVLPVFHKVLQSYHWIFHDWHHIFRGPGLHGNQHDPRVELFLVDLGGKRRKKKKPTCSSFYRFVVMTPALNHSRERVFSGINHLNVTPGTRSRTHTLGEFEWSLGVGGLESCKQSSHRVCHVDHCFGKVLSLAAGATQLYKLWRPRRQKHQSLKHRLDHSHVLENNSSGSSFINVLSGLSQCSCNHGNPLGTSEMQDFHRLLFFPPGVHLFGVRGILVLVLCLI